MPGVSLLISIQEAIVSRNVAILDALLDSADRDTETAGRTAS